MGNPKLSNQAVVPEFSPLGVSAFLLQQDFPYQEDVDSGHPLNLDYFIPVNCQRVVTGRLSFRLRLYRTYSNFSVTATSTDATNTTPATDASGESGHSHNHNHGLAIAGGAGITETLQIQAGGNQVSGFAYNLTAFTDTTTVQNNAAGSSGHSHSHNHGPHNHSHSHTVSGNSFLGVSEDVNNFPSLTVQFDGVDHTADIIPAGPYTTDQVELDVTKFISTKLDRSWHTISLSPSARGRIQAVLRVLYSSNQV